MGTPQEKALQELRRKACAEASAWVVRLHGSERNAVLEAGFRKWLVAHPENARQFEKVTETWERGAIPVPGVPRIHQRNEPQASRQWLLAAAMSALLVLAGVWGANVLWLNPSYRTGIGEQRVLQLSDGSRITLNSSSRVTVSYRQSQRLIRVDRGEVYFEVAKELARPFRVLAANHQVEALGTSFIVRREAHQLVVVLVEGKVEVSPLEAPVSEKERSPQTHPPQPVILNPGQRLRLAMKSSVSNIDLPRMDAVTAWRRGEVVLDNTTLADAIAEMNRYDHRKLMVDDPTAAALKISGIYHIGNSELFAAMVSRLYGVEVLNQEGQIHLASPVGYHQGRQK